MKFVITAASCFDETTGKDSIEELLKTYPFIKNYEFETEKFESGIELAFVSFADFAELAEFMRHIKESNASVVIPEIKIQLFDDDFSLEIRDMDCDLFY